MKCVIAMCAIILSGCEFLGKLDLTVNFVGDLFSVESLRNNVHFRQL